MIDASKIGGSPLKTMVSLTRRPYYNAEPWSVRGQLDRIEHNLSLTWKAIEEIREMARKREQAIFDEVIS
jgi:hypothetical protein